MSHLTGFIVENFRVFEERTQFNFAPINILTGTNSSGKSSLLKGLLLLKENFNRETLPMELEFNHDSHKLGSAEYVMNNKQNNKLVFGFPIKFPFNLLKKNSVNDENWQVILDYRTDFQQNKMKPRLYLFEMKEKKSGTTLIRFNFDSEVFYFENLVWGNQTVVPLINIELFKTINKELSALTNKKTKDGRNSFLLPEKIEDRQKVLDAYDFNTGIDNDVFPPANLAENRQKQLFNVSEKHIFIPQASWKFQNLMLSYVNNESNESLSDLEIAELVKLEKEALKNLTSGKSAITSKGTGLNNLSMYYDPFGYFRYSNIEVKEWSFNEETNKHEPIYNFSPDLKTNFSLFNSSKYTASVFEYFFYEVLWLLDSNSKLENISVDYKKYTQEAYLTNLDTLIPDNIKQIQDSMDTLLSYILKQICPAVKSIIYLPTARVVQSRVYNNNNSSNTLANLAGRIQNLQLKPDGIEFKFANEWLRRLGICESLEIDIIEGTSSRILVNKKGIKSNLIDQGFGVAQIAIVLMEIALLAKATITDGPNAYHSSQPVMIIEEPEANLHPKLQSKLADMFADAAEKFQIQFILETHSEYLIRKYQYLVARKILKPNDIRLFYFNDPEEQMEKDRVKNIQIQEDGSLSEDFGPGFFDEALNWKFEILKLKNLN